MKKLILILPLMFSALVHADTAFVVRSYADISSVTQNRLATLSDLCVVDYPAAPALASASFATKLTVPDGVMSLKITAMTIILNKRVGGVNLPPVPIAILKFNPEGDGSRPSVYARDAAGNIVSVTGTNVLNTLITNNPKDLYITEYNVPFGTSKPTLLGDYYEVVRTISGSYTLSGVPIPFDNIITRSKLVVVQKKNNAAIIYETPPDIETTTGGSASLLLSRTSLSPATYLKDWWIEVEHGREWRFSTEYQVSSDATRLIITFPGEHRGWRIVSTPSTP